MIVGNLKEEVEQVKKKLGLAALLMAVLLLVPSFAMAAPTEETTTAVYTLQVPVVNENGANYEIPLKITLYDVYEDSDLSKLVSVQKAAESTSFELWLNLSGVGLGSITGIDHNGNYVSIYTRSTGYYKGSWYSSKPGFKSLSTRGSHTCSYGNTVTTEPSCEAGGGTSRTCIYCGHKDVKTTGNALGHEFGEYIYDNNATCLADGTKTRTCSRCNQTETIAAEGTALGHDFGDYVFDEGSATCTTDGTKTIRCSRCNATNGTVRAEGTALGHDFNNYIYNEGTATCLANGTKTSKCSRCDATDTIEAEGTALGHDFANYTHDAGSEKCLVDGTKTGKCTRCAATDTVTDPGTALEHIFGEYVADNNASCTQDATETAHCTRENCDGKDVHTLEGTRLEHVSDNGTVTRKVTLRAAGEIEYRCTNCHTLLRTEAIPQLQSGIPKTGDNRTASLIFAALAVLGAAGLAGAAGYRKRSDAK